MRPESQTPGSPGPSDGHRLRRWAGPPDQEEMRGSPTDSARLPGPSPLGPNEQEQVGTAEFEHLARLALYFALCLLCLIGSLPRKQLLPCHLTD